MRQYWMWFDKNNKPIVTDKLYQWGGPVFLSKEKAQLVPFNLLPSSSRIRRLLLVPDDEEGVKTERPKYQGTLKQVADTLRSVDT